VDGDPADDDFAPFPRGNRHRATRLVTLIVVVALTIAVVGTGVGVLTSGGGSPKAPGVDATVLGVDGLPTGIPEATKALVTLRVTNRAWSAIEPACTVTVYARGAVAGTVTVHAQHALAHAQTVTAQLTVPLTRPVPARTLGKGTAVC
jgi:hypothetical protein